MKIWFTEDLILGPEIINFKLDNSYLLSTKQVNYFFFFFSIFFFLFCILNFDAKSHYIQHYQWTLSMNLIVIVL